MQIKEKNSFTLIEVIVASVIVGIGVVFLSGVIVTGKVMLKQAQNKAAAMNRAHLELDRWTALSYGSLDADQGNHPDSRTVSHGKLLEWDVIITQRNMSVDSAGPPVTRQIPYQEVEVNVEYDEDTLMRDPVRKQVRLTGFVPYPSLHIDSVEISQQGDRAPFGIYECVNDIRCSLPPGAQPWALAEEVRYLTDKDVIITYNIALDIVSGVGLVVTDALRSRVFIVDVTGGRPPRNTWTWYPIIAETPIMSQVSINGRLNVANIMRAGQTYLIGVEWSNRSVGGFGDIRVRRANLIIQASEPVN
ncbi:MAG: type II secretion system GspH family protein [Omnitrophica bacterium]|nr:type II secretion system GspH family protein [Candidatus Omnitrophota bacterium]